MDNKERVERVETPLEREDSEERGERGEREERVDREEGREDSYLLALHGAEYSHGGGGTSCGAPSLHFFAMQSSTLQCSKYCSVEFRAVQRCGGVQCTTLH